MWSMHVCIDSINAHDFICTEKYMSNNHEIYFAGEHTSIFNFFDKETKNCYLRSEF